ncbi:hypothetical protein JDN40_14295 [Rhodomicrobium vannielii ATCC 17100]|uniref:hypothetical protein n=1 Tax=Rhodomicrobium vannielii TaxID=1069 RepID=UPI001919F122|nr:hypothetical protein [Rhodomicrobium vannielii]MBJ7535278.1 hypothetical protein [Rhodomicrobium vannielii ATCC 17100]
MVSVKHKFNCELADAPSGGFVKPSNWNEEHELHSASGVILGRKTAEAGAVEELPPSMVMSLLCDGAAFFQPGGYLTLASGTPRIGTSVSSSTIYYTPDTSGCIPARISGVWMPVPFPQLSLALTTSSHLAANIYDVYVALVDGSPTLMTGPAWASSVAGSSSRGTSADLSRVGGMLVNAAAFAGVNGESSYVIDNAVAVYLGTLLIDATAGQVTCHTEWGQNRTWGVWNAYNRRNVRLLVGDSTSTYSVSNSSWHASNSNDNNSCLVLTGLPECIDSTFIQKISSNNRSPTIGIGVNSTSSPSGVQALAQPTTGYSGTLNAVANCYIPAVTGLTRVYCLEVNGGSNMTYHGTSGNMQLSVGFSA